MKWRGTKEIAVSRNIGVLQMDTIRKLRRKKWFEYLRYVVVVIAAGHGVFKMIFGDQFWWFDLSLGSSVVALVIVGWMNRPWVMVWAGVYYVLAYAFVLPQVESMGLDFVEPFKSPYFALALYAILWPPKGSTSYAVRRAQTRRPVRQKRK